jgi:hypothetical protein
MELLHNSKTFSGPLNFELTKFNCSDFIDDSLGIQWGYHSVQQLQMTVSYINQEQNKKLPG